ncbi:hypothetical protein ASG97_21495 [Bacillus sp. Soil745]|nr:hypothetical protein ASG97_21495 [Bacillus sp. Soil745]
MLGYSTLLEGSFFAYYKNYKKIPGNAKNISLEEETIQAVAGEREFSNFYVYGGYFYTLFECAVINKAKRII